MSFKDGSFMDARRGWLDVVYMTLSVAPRPHDNEHRRGGLLASLAVLIF